jgi:hypothetical protein
MLNTRHDYEYVRQHHDTWRQDWYNLLDGRFVIDNNELVEDANAQLFRLGFTVKEVESGTGHTGYTRRELEWYQSQPERYRLEGDGYAQVDGWAEAHAQAELLTALEIKLAEIDAAVTAELRRPFVYLDNTWYLDIEYIQGVFSASSLLPDTWSMSWKTADKPDGINNVYVILDKAGVAGLAMAALQRKSGVWAAGDELKKTVKAMPTVEAIEAFVVVL